MSTKSFINNWFLVWCSLSCWPVHRCAFHSFKMNSANVRFFLSKISSFYASMCVYALHAIPLQRDLINLYMITSFVLFVFWLTLDFILWLSPNQRPKLTLPLNTFVVSNLFSILYEAASFSFRSSSYNRRLNSISNEQHTKYSQQKLTPSSPEVKKIENKNENRISSIHCLKFLCTFFAHPKYKWHQVLDANLLLTHLCIGIFPRIVEFFSYFGTILKLLFSNSTRSMMLYRCVCVNSEKGWKSRRTMKKQEHPKNDEKSLTRIRIFCLKSVSLYATSNISTYLKFWRRRQRRLQRQQLLYTVVLPYCYPSQRFIVAVAVSFIPLALACISKSMMFYFGSTVNALNMYNKNIFAQTDDVRVYWDMARSRRGDEGGE